MTFVPTIFQPFVLMCEYDYEDCSDEADLPEVVYQSAGAEKSAEVLVDEIGVMLREHYRELRECVSEVASMSGAVERGAARGGAGGACAAQRAAVEACLRACCAQPLRCDQLVRQLADCARTYAIKHI